MTSYEWLCIFKSFCFSVFLCVLNNRSLSNIDTETIMYCQKYQYDNYFWVFSRFLGIVNIFDFLFYVLLNHICLGNVICIQLYNIQIGSVREGVVGTNILCGVITISCFHHSLVCFHIKMFREKSVHHHKVFFLLMLF